MLKETKWKKNNKIPQKADNVASSRFILVIILVLSLTGLMINATLSFSQVIPIQLETIAKQTEVGAAHDQLVNILANDLETRINKSGSILEITSKLPEVMTLPNVSSIKSELHGIPKNLDVQKRKVAQDIMAIDKDFQVVFFLMPNGEVYFVEPYIQQQNLTGNNFSFRDYYKGAINTRNTFLSNVIISAALGRPQANIAVPLYSDDGNQTLIGLWATGLNLTRLSVALHSLNLTDNGRIVYVDGKGQKIVDSGHGSLSKPSTSNESFAYLQSFKNAMKGESGSISELVNGSNMIVSYHSVKAFSNTWAVLFMEPVIDLNSNTRTTIMQNYPAQPKW
jgi:hypothetical protein